MDNFEDSQFLRLREQGTNLKTSSFPAVNSKLIMSNKEGKSRLIRIQSLFWFHPETSLILEESAPLWICLRLGQKLGLSAKNSHGCVFYNSSLVHLLSDAMHNKHDMRSLRGLVFQRGFFYVTSMKSGPTTGGCSKIMALSLGLGKLYLQNTFKKRKSSNGNNVRKYFIGWKEKIKFVR